MLPRCSLHLILSLAMAMPLLSCGAGRYTKQLLGAQIHLLVEIDSKANQDNPVAVDVVFVHDEKLLKEINKLSAREWFQKKAQIMREFQVLEDLDVWEWEWVPGEKVSPIDVPYKAKAKGGLVFANYLTRGDHRVRIDPHDSFFIQLQEDDLVVAPLDRVEQ